MLYSDLHQANQRDRQFWVLGEGALSFCIYALAGNRELKKAVGGGRETDGAGGRVGGSEGKYLSVVRLLADSFFSSSKPETREHKSKAA